jgi:hypothetical protein
LVAIPANAAPFRATAVCPASSQRQSRQVSPVSFLDAGTRGLATINLVVIARADDTTFGILHSRFHELWSLRLGTSLEDRPALHPDHHL